MHLHLSCHGLPKNQVVIVFSLLGFHIMQSESIGIINGIIRMGSKSIWPWIRNEILFHPDRFFNDHVRINDCAGSLCVGIASSGNNKATARVQYIPRCQGDFGTRGHQRSRKRMRVSILILFIPPGVFWVPATPKKTPAMSGHILNLFSLGRDSCRTVHMANVYKAFIL